MENEKILPEFRFYYFTNRYNETVSFYRDTLQLDIVRSWSRPGDKGTIFLSPNGTGWIEIEEGRTAPVIQQGGLYIQVANVDQWYAMAIAKKIPVIQPITDTSYGHRSFKIEDPNKLVIGLFMYNKETGR